MPTRPTNSPLYATDATILTGPETGQTTRLNPGAGILAQGILAGVKLPGRVIAHILGTHGDWINYTDQRVLAAQVINWPERASFHNAGDSALPNLDLDMAFAPTLGVNQGGRFVLINPGNVAGMNTWSSDDGNQWEFSALASAAHTSVAYGLVGGVPGFVMTYAGGVGLYTSTTGLSWSTLAATVPAHGVACYSPTLTLWVIAGDSGQIYTSPTALAGTWTARTTPAGWIAGSGGVKRAVFANGLFVILPLGSYNKCLTSANGISWTERTLPATLSWTGLAWSDHDQLWIAGSSFTPAASSPDGLTWTAVGAPTWAGSNDLACLGPVWVSVSGAGYYGGISWSVDRGVTWQRVAVGNHRVATAGWNRILAADNRFLVTHTDGAAVEVALSLRSA